MKPVIFCLIFLLIGLTSPKIAAQNRFIQLTVPDNEAPVGLDQLDVKVIVTGNIATTTLDMHFYNPNGRMLEGELNFPLGEGQSVTRYALEVNGKLREAVAVEKDKGRQTFEQIVNQRIDPGLLEMTKGNNFKTRIYPIPPKGYKRVVIAYEQELIRLDDDWLYQWPVPTDDMIRQFNMRIEVAQQKEKPRFKENPLTNLSFENWQNAWIAEKEAKNFQIKQPLTLQIPLPAQENVTVFTEKDPESGQTYFYLNTILNQPPPPHPDAEKRPESVALVWDVSASQAEKDLRKELAILEEYLKKFSSIRLITFSNQVHENRLFKNWNTLKNDLKKTPYDGATQYGALDLADIKEDEILLCTNGISNFGEQELKTGNTPIQVINSNAKADHGLLKEIAFRSGGQYLNLLQMNIASAVEALSATPYRFISAEFKSGDIKEVYPKLPEPVNGQFSLAGIMNASSGNLKLNFGYGKFITHSQTVEIRSSSELPEKTVKKLWANKKLEQLNRRYEDNKAAIAQLGKEMNIVTRNSSLIVLDRVEDYVQYEIEPPAELRLEYDKLLAENRQQEELTLKEHRQKIVALYQKRIEWWKKEFKPEDESNKKTTRSPRFRLEDEEADSFAAPATEQERREREDAYLQEASEMREEELSEEIVSFDANEPAMAEAADEEVLIEKKARRKKGKIKLKNWEPQTAYLDSLKNTPKAKLYDRYLALKADYVNSPSFFLDVSNHFFEVNRPEEGLRILSNTAEMELESAELYRILGHRLRQLGYFKLAIGAFEQVLEWRPEHPQSYRDLASALEADKQYQRALDTYWDAILQPWEGRFGDVQATMTQEMNALIATCGQILDTEAIDEQLIYNLPVDMRVVLNWSADRTDIDLWVIDPRGEKCSYNHKTTAIGGHLWYDFTQGLGPEEFWLKKAIEGNYIIKANYFGSNSQRVLGPVILQLELYTNYGTNRQKKEEITLRLENKKEVIEVGNFIF